jgi:hypothetical protein
MLYLQFRLVQYLQIITDLSAVDLHVSIEANYKKIIDTWVRSKDSGLHG